MTPRPCVLIVESKHEQVIQMRERLRSSFPRGLVACVSAGERALSIDLSRFNIILLGYHLPDCSGLELLERLVARVSVPIVMVTSLRSKDAATSAIRTGASDYIVKTDDYLDVLPVVLAKNLVMAALWRNVRSLQCELERRCDELRQKNDELNIRNEQLREAALRDPLTGLYNRGYVNEAVGQLLSQARRQDEDLACMMIDVDRFKCVNDSLGHMTGDRLLQLAGQAIAESVRASDIAARFGGDEFIVLLPRTSFPKAFACAKRISTRFKDLVAREVPKAYTVTLSIGVSGINVSSCRTVRSLIASADQSLYACKANGGGGVFPGLDSAA